jgi:hypothetical protein
MIELTGARFIVLLDASALFSIRVTNLVLDVAKRGVFQVRWSDAIHDEWTRALVGKKPGTDPAGIARRRQVMDQSFPDALVTGFEHLVDSLKLPDADDRHVLAAAIASRADVIVTFNVKHFPPEQLAPFGLEAQHPDDFLMHQMGLAPVIFWEAAKAVRQRLHKPPQSPDEFLKALIRAGLPQVAFALAKNKDAL